MHSTESETKQAKKRTFKIVISDKEYKSRIVGSTPKQAAAKALTRLIKMSKSNGESIDGPINFTIRETTRGSRQKEYNYSGHQEKLETPTQYEIRDANGGVKTITNRYRNRVEKLKL